MNALHALILGIVEGFSEFLPVSSTGHLILTSELLKLTHTDFLKSFEIAIQLGAILSVVVLYFKSLTTSIETYKKVSIAFLPTAIIGFVLYKLIKQHLIGNIPVVLGSLAIGGIVLVLFEWRRHEPEGGSRGMESISYKQAFFVGVFQSLAVIPGVSRSAATIIGGQAIGIGRKAVVDFTFLLAIPTMLAATVYDLIKNGMAFTRHDFGMLLIGFVTSFIVALFAVKFLLAYIKKHNFVAFGFYRIAVAIIMAAYLYL